MKLWAWWGLGMALAGCSAALPAEPQGAEDSAGFYADHAAPTREQAVELAKLPRVDESYFRPVTHDLAFLHGALGDAAGDAPAAAVAFVAAHPAIFLGGAVRVDQVQAAVDGVIVRTSQMAGGRRVVEGG